MEGVRQSQRLAVTCWTRCADSLVTFGTRAARALSGDNEDLWQRYWLLFVIIRVEEKLSNYLHAELYVRTTISFRWSEIVRISLN